MHLTAVAAAVGIAYAAGRVATHAETAAYRREATTDQLTGLPNRNGLFRDLIRRTGTGSPYTVAMLDLNGFKAVNDTYGHAAGDALLQVTGARLRDEVRGAFVARLGGDEFVVVAADGADPATIAERLRATITTLIVLDGVVLQGHDARRGGIALGVAIGFARSAADRSHRQVLKAADQAMYRAKRGGRLYALDYGLCQQVHERPRRRIRDSRGVAGSPRSA